MGKRLLALLLTLALVAGTSPLALAFEMIQTGHWAAEAVQTLNTEGVLIGYPDGTFRGNQAATRYELAIALKRLENVVQGLSVSGQAQGSDVANVKQVLADITQQLAKLGEGFGALEDRADQTDRALARRDQFLNDLVDRVIALEQAVQTLEATTQKLAAEKADKADLDAQLAKITERLAALEKAIPGEAQVRAWMQSDLQGLKSQLDKLAQENAALRAESDKQKKSINRMYWALGLGLVGVLALR